MFENFGWIALVALVVGIAHIAISYFRTPRWNFGGEQNRRPPQPQGNRPGARGRVGLFFLVSTAIALLVASKLKLIFPGLPELYPWNGVFFLVVATTGFFIKLRRDSNSWGDVWDWFTTQVTVVRRWENGTLGEEIVYMSYKRISGFVLGEGFCLVFFTAFFKYIVPLYPEVVLGWMFLLMWFIIAGHAENLVDRLARWFSWGTSIAIVGAAFIITIHVFFFEHIEVRMISTAFIALMLGLTGVALHIWGGKGTRGARITLYVVCGLGIVTVSANFVGARWDKPAYQWTNQLREFQDGKRETLDVRSYPKPKPSDAPVTSPRGREPEANTGPIQTTTTSIPASVPLQPPVVNIYNQVPPPQVRMVIQDPPAPSVVPQRQARESGSNLPQLDDAQLMRLAEELDKIDDDLYRK